MTKINVHKFSVLFVLFPLTVKEILSESDIGCASTRSDKYNITWPATTWAEASRPPCLNQAKEFAYRNCHRGKWMEEPECVSIQNETLSECPKGYSDGGRFCYTVSKEVECPFYDVLPFNEYRNIISERDLGPVWMPVKRNDVGIFQWSERSSLYKLAFNETYHRSSNIRSENCLLFYNTSYIVATSCEDQHSRVCAYEKLTYASNQLCGNSCFESDFMIRNRCFCIQASNETQLPKAEFINAYQTLIYKKVTNKMCTIGLEKTSTGTYIWKNSQQEIDYTYWSSQASFNVLLKFGAATPKGWFLTASELSCSLVQKEVDEVVPTLELTFDKNDNDFTLVATGSSNLRRENSNFLIFCFTDAHPTELLYRFFPLNMTYDSNDVTIFKFNALEFGPGTYWCESFTYSNSAFIQTDMVFYRQKNLSEYVALFDLELPNNSKNAIDTAYQFFFDNESLRNFYVFRIMKVVYININQVLLNVHISKISEFVFDEEEEYRFLKMSLDTDKTRLLDFLSSDFCLSVTDNFTWPKTKIGSFSTSEEFCFFSNASRPVRYCGGTFLDGARWSPSDTATCEPPEFSQISETIINVLNNSSLEAITTVCEISNKFHEFKSFDIYLFGAFFEVLEPSELYSDLIKVNTVLETIDNLLNVNKSVLRESQLTLNATDKLLRFVDTLIRYKNAPDLLILNVNFVFVSSVSQNVSGISVFEDKNGGFIVKLLEKDELILEDLVTAENLLCLLWLSPELRSQLNKDDRVSILLYRNSGFFTDTLTDIFNIQLSANIVSFKGPITILYRVTKNDSIDVFCAYWNFGLTFRGSWNRDNQVKVKDDFHICEFWHTGNLALIGNEKTQDWSNVTRDLNDVLYNNYSVAETMKKLENISRRHMEFNSEDVFLLSQILNKVRGCFCAVDLKLLAKTIHNSLEIDSKILQESQMKTKATDLILKSIDDIVLNSDQQSTITEDNFFLFSIDIKITNFSGLVICSDNQDPQILTGEIDLQVVLDDNVKGAVVLSPELKAQLMNDSKIIITVFFKNSFFSNNNSHSNCLIFGVILPNVGEYLGPVSTYHSVRDRNNVPMCVHWYYNPTMNVSGFWRRDTQGLLLLAEDKYEDKLGLLAWVNFIGAILSVCGFCGILLTAVIFKKWRSNKGNQILLNFAVSVVLLIVIYYLSVYFNDTNNRVLCITISAVLHYSLLSQFCWMFVIGILQFKRFVVVFAAVPKYLVLKACLVGWGLPLPFVIFTLIFSSPEPQLQTGLCYPSDLNLILGVLVPTGIILVFNFGVFIYIIYSICDRKFHCGVGVASGNEIIHQRRIAVLLFFLLGISWIFGLLANLECGVVFIYLFNFTASFQCFIVFLYFIVLNKSTRDLYVTAFKKLRRDY